jgi:RNA polymerase sigma-70 factor (ECF subfamily)
MEFGMTGDALALNLTADLDALVPSTEHAVENAVSDYKLAQRVAAGDMEAFEEIYSLYYRKVYNLCYRMLQNPTESEDLAHDVFVHVYRKIDRYNGQSALMTWLYRVTVNQILMHFRSRKSRPQEVTPDESTLEFLSFDSHAPRVEMPSRLDLEAAISKLPAGYRLVLLLHDVEGYEHSEIARIVGISAGTSKSQLHKARLKLRKLLSKKALPRISAHRRTEGYR